MTSLFSTPKAPPAIKPPAPIPQEDDQAIRDARRKQLRAQQARSGRQSTILSQEGSTLGG